jgi:hypothetical protein
MMVKIPEYNASETFAVPTAPQVSMEAAGAPGRALEQAGATAFGLGQQLDERTKAALERQRRLADANIMTEGTIAFHGEVTTELTKRQTEGDPTSPLFTQGNDEYVATASERAVEAARAAGMTEEGLADFTARLGTARIGYFENSLRTQKDAEERKATLAIDGARNQLNAQVAADPPSLPLALDGLSLGLGDYAGALDKTFLAGVLADGREQLVATAVSGYADAGAFDAARALLAQPDYEKDLSPGVRGGLADAIDRAEDRERARVEAEQRKAMADLAGDLRDAEGVILAGYEPPDLEGLRRRAAGTELAPEFERLVALGRESRAFALLPPADQAAELNRSAAGIVKTAAEVDRLQVLGKVYDNNIAAIKEDPLAHASALGIIGEVQAIDLADPASLAFRADQAKVASQHFGVEVPPLREAEAEGIIATMDGGDEPGAVAILDALRQGFGDDGLSLIAGGVVEKRPSLAIALEAAGQAPAIAREIIKGERVYRTNANIRPTVTDVTTAMVEAFGNTFVATPGAMVAYRDAGLAIYAARLSAKGELGLDAELLEQSLRDAAGDPIEVNGQSLIPPRPGMDEYAFRDLVDGITTDELARFGNGAPIHGDGTPFTATELGDAIFISIGPGRYRVGNSDLGLLLGRDGPYELDLGALLKAPRTAGVVLPLAPAVAP